MKLISPIVMPNFYPPGRVPVNFFMEHQSGRFVGCWRPVPYKGPITECPDCDACILGVLKQC